jgi:hypothetical protein
MEKQINYSSNISSENLPNPSNKFAKMKIIWGKTFLFITELHINKGTPYLSFMGRGDFSRPDIGRLKPPYPRRSRQK